MNKNVLFFMGRGALLSRKLLVCVPMEEQESLQLVIRYLIIGTASQSSDYFMFHVLVSVH